MKKKEESQTVRALKKIRNDWGAISPVTKVIPNKKKQRKEKYKKKDEDYERDE